MVYIMQLVTAFIGSLGFAMLFHVQREKLLLASLGGLLAWGAYLLMGFVSGQDVVRYFFASVALTVYAETMARVVKCPATLFLITAAIPLVPGGSLYKTMQLFMEQDFARCSAQGLNTSTRRFVVSFVRRSVSNRIMSKYFFCMSGGIVPSAMASV